VVLVDVLLVVLVVLLLVVLVVVVVVLLDVLSPAPLPPLPGLPPSLCEKVAATPGPPSQAAKAQRSPAPRIARSRRIRWSIRDARPPEIDFAAARVEQPRHEPDARLPRPARARPRRL
jgi:hypothetical protein